MAINNADIGFVRKFDVSDLDRVVEIANRELTEYYTGNLILDLYQSWPDAFLVYIFGNQVVGFIIGSKFSNTEARILLLAVDRKFRHLGFGKALMDDFLKICVINNLMSMRLEVRTDNDEAIRFYKRYGFVITSTIRAYYSDSSNAYLMWKII